MLAMYTCMVVTLVSYAKIDTWDGIKQIIHKMFSCKWTTETHSVRRMLLHANRFSIFASIIGLSFVIFYLVLKAEFVAHSNCKYS